MNVAKLFKSLHGMLDEDELLPAMLLSPSVLEGYNMTDQDIENVADLLGVDEARLYYNPEGGLYPFCYWDKFFYYGFHSLSEAFMSENTILNEVHRFNVQRNKLYELFSKKNYKEIISRSDKKVTFLLFENLLDQIPKTEQKELFLSIYTSNEYGFDRLNHDTVRTVLNMRSPKENEISLHVEPGELGMYYEIYRGATEKSSPLDKAYSWTLNYNTALYFASRFDSEGTVYSAKVRIDHVKAYIAGRHEHEVIVFPEHVEDIKEVIL